jgi:CDP-diacylglycerol--glycerol-3-phosphate 3-phosphatidyltransferase
MAAAITFTLACVTDYVDGWVARRHNLVTAFGKLADPIADKAVTGTALVILSAFGVAPWWVTGLILAREIGITLLRLAVVRRRVIPANTGGKLKTLVLCVAIAWMLWPMPAEVAAGGRYLLYLGMVITVVTGVDYVWRAVRAQPLAATSRDA